MRYSVQIQVTRELNHQMQSYVMLVLKIGNFGIVKSLEGLI